MVQISRRQVLVGAAGLATFSDIGLQKTFAADGFLELTARTAKVRLSGASGPESDLIGYDGQVPGPTLRFTQGQIARVRFRNELDVPSTIHWHGIRLENAMDGVPGLTQQAVQPGSSFDYEFTPPDAGTFWYHAHVDSWNQVARGLFGALIIDEVQPAFDPEDDHVLVLTDWKLTAEGVFDSESLGNVFSWSGAGRIGNFLTVNGVEGPEIAVATGAAQRLRLINTSTARVLKLKLTGVEAKIIARDGQPLAAPQDLRGSLKLGPAQRVDLMAEFPPDSAAELKEVSWQDIVLVHFTPSLTSVPRPAPALAAADLPVPDLTKVRWFPLRMTGGNLGSLEEGAKVATMAGDMAMHGDEPVLWAFNNVSRMGDEPMFQVASGETVGLRMENTTFVDHAIHIHGHDFRQVPQDDSETPDETWFDTILIGSREVLQVAFVAGKPGKWMIHCHMLEHSVSGMDTWFRVV